MCDSNRIALYADTSPENKGEPYEKPNGGEAYLFWSMAGSNTKAARPFMLENAAFRIMLSVRGTDKEELLQQGLAAFWLLTHLGSIGLRSHRGDGSRSQARRDIVKKKQACGNIVQRQSGTILTHSQVIKLGIIV